MNLKNMKVRRLEWDSDFFEKEIGDLIVGESINISVPNNFDLIYVKATVSSAVVISGFYKTLEQTKIIFRKQIREKEEIDLSNIYSVKTQANLRYDLYDLAYESGKFSRFFLDPNINVNKFRQLYVKWVDNSFLKDFADEVFVYKEKDSILGFVTYQIVGEYAVIGLVAVKPKTQGKGLGSKLIKAVENRLFLSDVKELRIPTQLENKQACKFYTKLGYEILEKEYIKHFWNNDTIQ